MTRPTLAIDGGTPVRSGPWPPWPAFGEDCVQAAAEVIRSGRMTSLTGDAVARFEQAFAAYHRIPHCLATSSGTTAIHLALAGLGLGPGDEVIVPAHTFIASATPVLHQGATAVFADVDPVTYTLLPPSVEAAAGPRTKAIVAVHLNGHPAPMDELGAIARRHGAALVEDAAQAHGAVYHGRTVGTIGDIGCFSFWEDKIMSTAGEGGAVITANAELARRMARVRSHGEGPIEGERRYFHLELGYNYRLAAVLAAVGQAELGRLDEYLARRRRNAARIGQALAETPEVEPPAVAEGCVHSYYKYILKLRPERLSVSVDRFAAAVAAEGVPCSRRYPTPLHQQPVFRDAIAAGRARVAEGGCPNAEALAGCLLTLTVHPTLTDADVDAAAEAVAKVAAAYGRR